MKKQIKLFSYIIAVSLLVCFGGALVSCDTEATDENDQTSDVQNTENITKTPTEKLTEDITEEPTEEPTEEIIDDKEIETLPITPCPFDEESLEMPAEIKREIQIAVLTRVYGEEYVKDGYTPEYVWVVCYGIFDDAYCCMIWDHSGAELSVETEVEVGGYTFMFGSPNTMLVYCDGEFYGLKQAYENGILDDTEIAELYTYYTETRWG